MQEYSLNIKLKNEQHLQLLQTLINSIIYNFIKRYCIRNKKTHRYILSTGLNELLLIDLWNYIWDSFNHIYNLDKFKELHYISIAEQNELFSMIMCIIDESIIAIDNNSDNNFNEEDDKQEEI